MPRESLNGSWVRAALVEHEAALIRYARSVVGDADRARDVVQDTFLRLCRQQPDVVRPHLRAWLYTVCRRRALDVLRKERRMHTTTDSVTWNLPTALDDAPAQQAEAGETRQRLLAELETLPGKQREVVRLKFQAGLSYRDIADAMDLKVGYVGYLLHTALKTLRERMA
ncbi:MAG: sigma-70 family RNA polymerase sigma factor [Phycisphaeraceae bacterium]